jgi:hypothetical protein
LLVLLACALPLGRPVASEAQAAIASTTTALTPAQASEDLELAIAALEAALPDIHWHQTPAEWRAAKAAARARVGQVTDSEGLWRALMPLLAQIGEGHLSLATSEAMKRHERDAGLLLPLSVLWNEQGAYVVSGYGEASDLPRGARILSIDGRGTQALADDLMLAATRDGTIRTGILREASGRGYGELLYRMTGSHANFHLVLQTEGGRIMTRDVAGVPPYVRNDSPHAAKPAVATLEWLDERTAYLDVPTFSNRRYREAGADFQATLQRIFEELDRRGATRLILDLRDNGGGSEPNESILFSYLVRQPLRKYEAVGARGRHVSVHDASGRRYEAEVFDKEEMKQQRRLPNGRLTRRNVPPEGLMTRWSIASPVYGGRLVVLAGGNTFSGGAELASMLFHVRRAVFVGEEVGGTHEGNTSGYRWSLTLPNSGMTLRIPLLQFRFAWPGLPHDRGVRPDCAVPPDAMEFDQPKDAAWRAARDILRETWTSPKDAACPVENVPFAVEAAA